MVALLVFTIVIHYFFHTNFDRMRPLLMWFVWFVWMLTSSIAITNYLPMSLATHKLAERLKKNKQEDLIDKELDLFSHDRTSHNSFRMVLITQDK